MMRASLDQLRVEPATDCGRNVMHLRCTRCGKLVGYKMRRPTLQRLAAIAHDHRCDGRVVTAVATMAAVAGGSR